MVNKRVHHGHRVYTFVVRQTSWDKTRAIGIFRASNLMFPTSTFKFLWQARITCYLNERFEVTVRSKNYVAHFVLSTLTNNITTPSSSNFSKLRTNTYNGNSSEHLYCVKMAVQSMRRKASSASTHPSTPNSSFVTISIPGFAKPSKP